MNIFQTAVGAGSQIPSPRYGNPRPRSLQMQKVDSDYSTNMSRRNSEISPLDNRLEEQRKTLSDDIGSVARTGNNKLKKARDDLSEGLNYAAAGVRRASKYDLY